MSTVVDRIMAGGGQILINSTGTYATRAPGNVPETPSPGNWHPVVLVVVRITGTVHGLGQNSNRATSICARTRIEPEYLFCEVLE